MKFEFSKPYSFVSLSNFMSKNIKILSRMLPIETVKSELMGSKHTLCFSMINGQTYIAAHIETLSIEGGILRTSRTKKALQNNYVLAELQQQCLIRSEQLKGAKMATNRWQR